MMCIYFIFFGIFSDVNAQVYGTCQNGLSMALYSDAPSSFAAIPFGTPILVTTEIFNNGTTEQVVSLQTSINPTNAPTDQLQLSVLCAGDYFWNGSVAQRNNFRVPAGGSVISTITLMHLIDIAGQTQNPQTRRVQSTLFVTGLAPCSTTQLTIPVRNSDAAPLGLPGQTTTINAFTTNQANATSLIIRGNVILNVNHILKPTGNGLGVTFPYIYMDEGATLTISSGTTLELRGVSVFGIRSMWNSIIVESGGTLITGIGSDGLNTVTRKTSIKDGISAIVARNGSTIDIKHTDFEDNVRGFHVPPTNGALQNITFNSGFWNCSFTGTGEMRPMPAATPNCNSIKDDGFPYAGMDINDLGSLITVNGAVFNTPRPSFRNMSNGIVARRTRLFVNQAQFENIKSSYTNQGGLGIHSSGPNSLLLVAGQFGSPTLDFFNCSTAIAYQQFGFNDLAQVNSIRIDNTGDDVGFGITAAANSSNQSYLYAMNIAAKVGIRSLWNALNVGEIYDNVIDIINSDTPSASFGISAQELSSTGNWNIYRNSINIADGQAGIRFNSGTGATLTNNNVNLLSGFPSDAKGIQLGGTSNANVRCNDIVGGGGSSTSGLFVSGGTGLSYTCNNTTATQFGMNITGQSTPFTMNANRFNSHHVGLLINDATVIGLQSLGGNKWQGPFTSFGAEHLDPDPFNVRLSTFEVSNSAAPIMPAHNVLNPDWFQVVIGTDETCASLNACPNGNPAGRVAGSSTSTDEAFYTSAISEQRMQTPNAEEVKWTAQRNAYGRLMNNPSEQNNRNKANFIGRMRNTSTGQLYQVEKGVKDAQKIGQEYGDALMTNANTIKTLANEIADLDAKIFTAKDAEKKALIAQKKEKNATIHRLSTENAPRHATIERKRNQEIQRLIRDNERISTRLQPEINEKEVNAIYLATVAQGKMELNSEQKATVRLIAYQCPSLGGNAVFAARSLYSLVENVNFDDLALCNARLESVQGLKIKKVETFKVSPSPATDMLTVSQSTEKVEAGEWQIFDTAGKLLLSKKVNENDVETTVGIQNLSEGIYFVSFSVNGQKRFNQKLVKIKSN